MIGQLKRWIGVRLVRYGDRLRPMVLGDLQHWHLGCDIFVYSRSSDGYPVTTRMTVDSISHFYDVDYGDPLVGIGEKTTTGWAGHTRSASTPCKITEPLAVHLKSVA